MYIVYIDCIDNCCNSTAILLIKFHVHRACHLETVKWIRLFMPCWNFEHVVIAFWSGDKYVHSYVSNSKWSSNHYSILYKILFKIKHSIRVCSWYHYNPDLNLISKYIESWCVQICLMKNSQPRIFSVVTANLCNFVFKTTKQYDWPFVNDMLRILYILRIRRNVLYDTWKQHL